MLVRLRRRSGLVALAAVVLAIGATSTASAAVEAGSETKTVGNVTALLSWDKGQYAPRNLRLRITRDATTAYEAKIPDAICPGLICTLTGQGDLDVSDLDGDGEPEVLVTGFSGGAHCCVVLGIYSFNAATGSYELLTRELRSAGYRLRDVDKDGRPEIDTLDVAYEDAFSSHAASFPPPQILRFDQTTGKARLQDVTRDYPDLIKKHAARALASIRRQKRGAIDCGGIVSGYVADQYLLGKGKVGLKELDRAAKKGLLGSKKQAKAFRRNLLGFLHETGYR